LASLDFVYFDAGGGHRSAATALHAVIGRERRPWHVRLVNLNDVLLPADILKKLTGRGLQDIYNLLLRYGWTLGMPQLLPLMHGLIRLRHSSAVELLARYWGRTPTDMVVSLVPQFNRAMSEAFRAVNPQGHYVTVLTDMADYPPHFWIERVDQDVICGTPRAVQQALAAGLPSECVHRVSGMILKPEFYEQGTHDSHDGRRRLGLDPETPTGLVLFGGYGAPSMYGIARRLQSVSRPLQLILICGHNRKLADRLRTLRSRIAMHVEGFTSEVPRFMQLADFLIGKPGPGSISEAVAMKLPVIVEKNAWTMPQERYNADWVVENGVGIVVRSFRGIRGAIERLLEPGVLEKCRARAAAIDNRAVFEIPNILQRILDGGK